MSVTKMADERRATMAEEGLKVPEETGRESERTEGQPTTVEERVEGTQHGFKRPMLPARRAAVRKAPGKAERTATTAPKPVTTTESRPDNRRRLLRRLKAREVLKSVPKNYLPRAAYRCYQKEPVNK